MASNEPVSGEKDSRKAGLATAIVGILLVGASFVPALTGSSERWTTEQASAYQDASMRIQKLTHDLGNQSPDSASRDTDVEFEKALDHFHDLRAELNDARNDRGYLKMALRVIGGTLGIAGLGYYFASKTEH
jgi:hypothetical protein